MSRQHPHERDRQDEVKAQSIVPSLLENLNWLEIESRAFQTFISDYCIPSSNRTVSRGYLNGLECFIEKAGPESCVAKSCRILSLANLGKKTASPGPVQRAEMLYLDLLPSFRQTISDEGNSTTIHSLITAVMLGLYEVRIIHIHGKCYFFDSNRSLRALGLN